jgi:hypothetical protein
MKAKSDNNTPSKKIFRPTVPKAIFFCYIPASLLIGRNTPDFLNKEVI